MQYWLEDWDLGGKRTLHGPVRPVLSKEPLPEKNQTLLLNELGKKHSESYREFWKAQALRERLLQPPSRRSIGSRVGLKASDPFDQLSKVHESFSERFSQPQSAAGSAARQAQWNLASRSAIKLEIREEGWYRVRQPDLVAAGLNPGVNPRRLRLFVYGQEQAILVTGEEDGRFDPEDSIEFYGVGLDTPSTESRVYWLVEGSGPGKRIKTAESREWSTSAQSFPHTIERKDRTIYFAALKNGEAENFFGSIITTEPVDQILNLPHLDPSSPGQALLEVALQGGTNVPHRVNLSLNGVVLQEISFDGQAHEIVKIAVSPSELLEGDNLLSFVSEGGETDVSVVDYIRLTYWHTYTADADLLRFIVPGKHQGVVDGFSTPDIRVMDITNPKAVKEVVGVLEGQEGNYAIRFGLSGSGQKTILAFTEEQIREPAALVAHQPSTWHKGRNSADLVIITHRDFMESLGPLKALRESQGLSVELIDVEDLYSEFSFGTKTPKALKDFLRRARTNWKKPPRNVLLVGDATFDPRNYIGLGNFDFVPTKLVDTVYLETASDDWFVDFNGDGLPEIAVGRLPVRTVEGAATVVSKIVGYEQTVA